MFASIKLTALTLLAVSAVYAQPSKAEVERERRVRVALALSASAQCGQCQFDEVKARAKAKAEKKPLVIFVGTSCSRCGVEVSKLGAVAVVVDHINKDDVVGPVSPQVVIQVSDKDTWETKFTLTAPSSKDVLDAVRTLVKEPEKKTGKKLDWDMTVDKTGKN